MPEPDETMRRKRVFVSYARDSAEHAASVEEFARVLRTEAGIVAQIREWYETVRRDWVAWVVEEIDRADFIIAIASPGYRRAVDRVTADRKGDLVHVEAALIRNILARDPEGELRCVLPVILPGSSVADIPDVLRPFATTRFIIPEISFDGVRDLLYHLGGFGSDRLPPLGPYLPTAPPDRSVVIATTASSRSRNGILDTGEEVVIDGRTYLVQGDPETEPTTDHAAVRRQARALLLGTPHEPVWLRQVEVRHETPAAKDETTALEREDELLRMLCGQHRGLPEPLGLCTEDRVTTLVIAWPTAGDRRDPCGSLADFVPRPGENVDSWYARSLLNALAGLCGALSALHGTHSTHRRLAPAGIIRHDDRTFSLRDLGDAGRASRPGAGPPEYRAPEQGHRRRADVGPWTDVFQLAAMAYHLVTSYAPAPGTPLPARALAPALPPGAAEAIDSALAVDPARRPGLDQLAVALRN